MQIEITENIIIIVSELCNWSQMKVDFYMQRFKNIVSSFLENNDVTILFLKIKC